MTDEILINIKKDIEKLIDSLETSLKQEMEKELKSQISLSHSFSDYTNRQALTLCLYKAKGYKKIELDFPDTLIPLNERLSLKFEAMRMELAKHYAIILGGSLNERNEDEIISAYGNIKLFFRDVFKKSNVSSTAKEKILDFLTVYLQKKESSVAIYKYNETLKQFFYFISLLIEKNFSVQADIYYVEKLNSLEKNEFFSTKISDAIQQSFYGLIREIDGLVLYKSLLVRMDLLAKKIFNNDFFLKEFVETFISQFIGEFPTDNTHFESIFVLLYLAFEHKVRTPLIETRSAWINSLGSGLKALAGRGGNLELTEFKNEYEKKIGNKFEVKLEQFRCINPNTEARVFRAEEVRPEIISWFFLEDVNQSSVKVKDAFTIALARSAYSVFDSSENSQKNKNDIKTSIEMKVGIFKAIAVESKDKLTNKVFRAYEQFCEHTQDKISSQIALEKIESEKKKAQNLVFLQERLNIIKKDLQHFNEKIQALFFGMAIIDFSSSPKEANLASSLNRDFLSITDNEEDSRLKNEVDAIEKIINKFFLHNQYPASFINKLLAEIFDIRAKNSWFEAKFFNQQNNIMEKVLRRGYFLEKQVKLTKLKARLNNIVSFEFEKSFFRDEGFFTLLRYGVIRWFWIDKEKFSKNWAEQIIFLKTIDEIKESGCEKKYERNGNSIDETKLFQKFCELYKQMVAGMIEKEYFIEHLFSNFSADINSFRFKIDTILKEIENLLTTNKKKSLAFSSKRVLASKEESFFNDQSNVLEGIVSSATTLRPS